MNLKDRLEAILFCSGEALYIEDLIKFFNIEKEEFFNILIEYQEEKKNTGINLKIYNDEKLQLLSNPEYGKEIYDFFNPEEKPKKLSRAGFEVLAIIAYKGPITKPEIERIRGVNSDKIISNLEDKSLIEICGQKKTIGNPNIYKVTKEFLTYLNLKDIRELPEYEGKNE